MFKRKCRGQEKAHVPETGAVEGDDVGSVPRKA